MYAGLLLLPFVDILRFLTRSVIHINWKFDLLKYFLFCYYLNKIELLHT